jgi:hypothetical protein
MKKGILLTLIFLFLISFQPLQARGDHPVNFYLNFGLMTDDSFSFDPLLWYAGFNFDFHINDLLMISPEGNLITQDFKFDSLWLEPAALLNVKVDHFFFGAGVGKWLLLTGNDTYSTDFFLKLNAGFSGDGGLRVRIFLNTAFDDLFGDYITIGAQLGIGI